MLTVYGAQWCVFCKKAKDFLEVNKIPYKFIDIDVSVGESKVIIEKDFKTIPQIFEGDNHLGGYTDLIKRYESI